MTNPKNFNKKLNKSNNKLNNPSINSNNWISIYCINSKETNSKDLYKSNMMKMIGDNGGFHGEATNSKMNDKR